MILPIVIAIACSCMGPGSPRQAAGRASAVFTGTVLEITYQSAPRAPVEADSPAPGMRRVNRAKGDLRTRLPLDTSVVKMQVGDVLSGVAPGQREIEIVTEHTSCRYSFQPGTAYVVYTYRDAEGRLQTNMCSRTRPLAQAAEDLEYFHKMANAPATGDIRVLTGYPGLPGKRDVRISVEGMGSRYSALTNSVGDALFTNLPPGEYTVHADADGDLPDDPKVQLGAKGALEVTLLRTLRITGRVTTQSGLPGSRVRLQVWSIKGEAEMGAVTNEEGKYEIRIHRPGRYHLAIDLNPTATSDAPHRRWFHPGTESTALAIIVEFSGKPDIQTYDFTLPN